MPKSIYVDFIAEQPNSNSHFLNRLIKVLNHFILIEPTKKTKGFESHHIVPRSWKPEWEKVKDNLLKVPTKAHYVIHHLMWKSFCKDFAMAKAFHQMSNRLNEKITAKVFKILKVEVSKAQSENALQRVADGTNPFLNKEKARQRANERVNNGTHNLLNGETQRKNNLKRVADGTNPFLGSECNNKRLANGTHPSQIKKTCPHCGKEIDIGNYKRWHRK